MKSFVALLSILVGLTVNLPRVQAATTVTFDDLDPTATGDLWAPISNGYAGLQWQNFGVINGSIRPEREGYHAGLISPDNVAFNRFGDPAAISRSTPFTLKSAYLTEQSDNSMSVRVEGWSGGRLAYNNSFPLHMSGPSFLQLDYAGVDRVVFISSVGMQFALEDVSVDLSDTITPTCTFELDPSSAEHGGQAETGTVSVTTQTGCAWAVFNANSWVTLLSSVNNSNGATLTYRVAANPRAISRSATLNIGGETFLIHQGSGGPQENAGTKDLGTIEVTSIGHAIRSDPFPFPEPQMPQLAIDFLIDQDQSSGGGAVLPPISTGWDSTTQFVMTVSAPAGQRFQIRPPDGTSASFGGFLLWESTRGGGSPVGPVAVTFTGLEGTPPDFTGSDAVLSDSHGYFGFWEITSSSFSGELSFTSMTLTGTVEPQYTGFESQTFVAHHESSLHLFCPSGDLGQFVTLVPVPEAPLALGIRLPEAGRVIVNWDSAPGKRYQLQVKSFLPNSTWQNCGAVGVGTGDRIEMSCGLASPPSSFV